MTDQLTARPSAGRGLPRPATSFVGRGDDVRVVTGLFASHRLVTLAGPGGAGKTRLAIEVARELSPAFPDGVWWVELAGLSDGSAVAGAAAEVTGALVDPRRGPLASLAAHLAGRRALLCLDNAEHLGDEVASVAEAAVQAGPEAAVLVTSREPLRLGGELVWRVPPLGDDEAVTLFLERAALVRPSYRPDPAGAAAIRAIVRHLDGIPLALELAAAWLGTLSAEQILAGLDDRFRLLVRGPRNAQRRQQTLAASIGWSHALLDEVDRALLRRLSVFAGPFPLKAVTAVGSGPPVPAGDELASLARLVDASLVMTEEHAGEVRYRLLETIRAFAGARLGETDEAAVVHDRHLRYYAGLAEAADAWREAEPDRWQATIQREYADLRAALDWALADGGDPDTGRRLAASMAWLWHLDRRGAEGVEYLRRAIGLAPEERTIVQARLLTGLALVLDTAAPLDLEYDAATRALELATELGHDDLRALCLDLAAVGACYTDFDQAWDLADQAAAAAPAGDGLAATGSRAVQALVLHHRDRHAEADAVFDDILPALVRQHRGIAATMLGFQATGALATGDVGRAQRLAAEGLRVALPLGDILRVGMARSVQAVVHVRAGDPDAAEAVLEPLVRLAGDDVFVTGLPYALGLLAVRRDDPAAAAAWFRRGAAASDRGVDSWIAAQSLAELGAVLAAAGEAAAGEATREATAALERAVATASRLGMPRVLSVARLAQAELAAAAPDGAPRAVELVHDALALQAGHGLRAGLPDTLEALARHGSAIRPTPDDVRVLGAADAARSALGLPRPPSQDRLFTATLAGLRTTLGADAAATAWAEGARLSLDDAVGFARRARGSRGRPASGWASLTPTELEVVALVAEGCSNPEIAARLLMGRGTVKTHLAHVFSKLEVANRTELASLASARARD